VDELDLFRDLGGGPVAPSDDVRRRASARLVEAIEREQASSAGSAPRSARRRYGVLAFAVTLVVAGTTALFLVAPWAGSPGFLERAQAALTPSAGAILHYRWQETRSSTQFSCTVTERPSEIWIDQTHPRNYRALLGNGRAMTVDQLFLLFGGGPSPSDDPRKQICSRGRPAEIGGDLTERPTLMFFPPDWLSYAPLPYRTAYDPAGDLRAAISAGRAHHEGQTTLAGRTVERIRIDPLSRCGFRSCREPRYAYVDPETYDLVQTESPYGMYVRVRGPGRNNWQFTIVARYLTFEYLPRTAANVALADIVAQHPKAGGPFSKKPARG
jgi:hypothetical protein